MRYLIKFPKHEATAMVEYDINGMLVKYELEPGAFGKEQFDFLAKVFPYSLNRLEKGLKSLKMIDVRELKEDISFDAFYDKYAHKVSKRSKAENIWKRMPDLEKAKAIRHIDLYETQRLKTGVNKKYPETYLNSEIWNN
ncbi:hypothetical protein [Brumimicrobium mesophilum]|uniref:hypothetical protein n=1 Tax=Brumimicrobium mesophilum TaxID=392717 RepID=UPI000D1437D5|nr:hypothetical protein [Brumimicrobium mesophilum]